MMIKYFTSPQTGRIAYRHHEGDADKPTLVWLSGFNSDMSGTKVTQLEAWAITSGHGFLAFDYSGHGLSDGEFADGTISSWRGDALAIIDALTSGPLILVGSSMGGWIALLAALARPDRVSALVLIAPAPDFTEKLMWPEFTSDEQAEIMEKGVYMRPSDYGDPYPITRALIEDGRKWLLLDAPVEINIPVRILQGMMDPDVPWEHAMRLVDTLATPDVTLTLIKDGDHRLSRLQDIERLLTTCAEISEAIDK